MSEFYPPTPAQREKMTGLLPGASPLADEVFQHTALALGLSVDDLEVEQLRAHCEACRAAAARLQARADTAHMLLVARLRKQG